MSESPIISLTEARAITGLDLVSGINIPFGDSNYAHAETATESPVHRKAKEEGISFFTSFGYFVCPEAVGVVGAYTLADFLALRDGRTVFVEVLSDLNLSEETRAKKEQFLRYGELCYICMTGSKLADSDAAQRIKNQLATRFDVLTYNVNPYYGIGLEFSKNLSVLWSTTKAQGISGEYSIKRGRKKTVVELHITTRMYQNPFGRTISYMNSPESHVHEQFYFDCIERLAEKYGCTWNRRPSVREMHYRAMRRKSGLIALSENAKLLSLCVEDRREGGAPETHEHPRFPGTRDAPTERFFGVFTLSRPDLEPELLAAVKDSGILVTQPGGG